MTIIPILQNCVIDDFRISTAELFSIFSESTRATAYVKMSYEKVVKPVSITAVLLVTAIASIGFGGKAFGGIEDSDDNDTTSSTTTAETAPSNASKVMGVISGIQLDENGNPAWITAGHWNLE